MTDSKRCASYYQNIGTRYQPIGDPLRCRFDREHEGPHEGFRQGIGWTRWTDAVQMIHPWQARAAGHGPNCVPDSKHPGYWICDLTTHPEAFVPPDLPAELYNPIMDILMKQGGREGLILADRLKNLFGASARRRRVRAPHQHEKWQLQESAQGGWYCAACGEIVVLCSVCLGRGEWLESPSGSWWSHEVHPADGHDFVPFQIQE